MSQSNTPVNPSHPSPSIEAAAFRTFDTAMTLARIAVNMLAPAGAPEIDGLPNRRADSTDEIVWDIGDWEVSMTLLSTSHPGSRLVFTWHQSGVGTWSLVGDGRREFTSIDAKDGVPVNMTSWPPVGGPGTAQDPRQADKAG